MNAYIILGLVIVVIIFKALSPVLTDAKQKAKEAAREKAAISKSQ